MEFDKESYKQEFEELLNKKTENKFYIQKSSAFFKIDKFVKKGVKQS